MSHQANIEIEGTEYIVHECCYKISTATDHLGMPAEIPRGGKIDLVIESSESSVLFHTAIDKTKTVNGKISFLSRNGAGNMKDLAFEEAYVTSFKESFRAIGDQTPGNDNKPMIVEITLSSRKITQDGGSHENSWPIGT